MKCFLFLDTITPLLSRANATATKPACTHAMLVAARRGQQVLGRREGDGERKNQRARVARAYATPYKPHQESFERAAAAAAAIVRHGAESRERDSRYRVGKAVRGREPRAATV